MRAPLDPAGPIYLDYNATTPVDPAVADLIATHVAATFGNPSSSHVYGTAAHAALDRARAEVGDLLGAAPDEVVLTGGGSESDNLAIKGIVLAARGRRDHIVTSSVEHPAVLATCHWLVERLGCRLTIVPVDGRGQVDPDAVAGAIGSTTALVTIMHANNEVGTLNPIDEIAIVCREHGVPFHTDAAQSVGKIATRVDELGVDLLTVAGHKLYAPKGIGALYIRRGTALDSLIHGAGHEAGRRAGTENVPYAAGLGRAAALCLALLSGDGAVGLPGHGDATAHDRAAIGEGTSAGTAQVAAGVSGGQPPIGEDRAHRQVDRGRAVAHGQPPLDGEAARLRDLRDQLEVTLRADVPELMLNGHPTERLPNTLNVSFPGVDGERLLAATPSVAASTGSACHAGRTDPSGVLLAMGIDPARALGAVRLTLGRWTTVDDIDRAAGALAASWRRLVG